LGKAIVEIAVRHQSASRRFGIRMKGGVGADRRLQEAQVLE
jgi:hypothetical protein